MESRDGMDFVVRSDGWVVLMDCIDKRMDGCLEGWIIGWVDRY